MTLYTVSNATPRTPDKTKIDDEIFDPLDVIESRHGKKLTPGNYYEFLTKTIETNMTDMRVARKRIDDLTRQDIPYAVTRTSERVIDNKLRRPPRDEIIIRVYVFGHKANNELKSRKRPSGQIPEAEVVV